IFYFLIFINLKLNYSENMNGPTDRSNDFCKTFGSYFRQAAEAQKKLVEITMSKVSPDFGEQAQYMVVGEFTEKSSIAGG
ncbi:MAG: hypothetical protein KBG98_06365, partial [Desulfobacter sp.]|uniref:hypothetical protein n=1 Tax=Desulfobacter sp. TaxID=2294 RepID=UPI001B6BC099